MGIVSITLEEARKSMTPEKIQQIVESAEKLPFVYDEDCPPLTEEQLKHFHRVVPKTRVV